MIAKFLLALVLTAWSGNPPSDVREVRIAPAGHETEITVLVQGDVSVTDFMLTNPPRLILDLEGARHALARETYEAVGRGGVVRVRSSQFRPDVVRLVFDLTAKLEYDVDSTADGVHVRFENPGESFSLWSSGPAAGARVAEAEPPRAVMGPGATAATASTAGTGMGVQAMQPRITVNYDSASMLDVLAGFSEFAGVSIVPNGGAADVAVRGIDIRDQPWDIALSAILSAQGLGWNTTDSGIIIVDKLENLRARDTLLSETRVMRINYASADSVAATLAQLATPQRGQVVAYAGTNSVIVTDAPSVVARMDSIVRALDKRTPQVAIEARIVFVDRSDVFELGIVYDLKERDGGFVEQGINDVIAVPDPNEPPQLVDTDGDGIPDQAFFKRTNETLVNIGGDALATLANANDRVVSPALQILTAVAFGEFSLFTFIEALEAHQLSDVQAVPSIRVAAERSALDVGPSDVGFIFKKQLGETRLLLSDGETAVIGGLTLSEVERSVSGIPGLMNIPLLGYLFRTTKEQESKTDLIILVTPHIVWPEDMQPPGR
jgi:type IV pilus assembly protein PilQ